jgi:hypothetical protein
VIKRGDVLAVKCGRKVVIDLNSIDEHYLHRCRRLAEPRTIVSLDDLTFSAMDLRGSSEAARSRDASAGTSGRQGRRQTHQRPPLAISRRTQGQHRRRRIKPAALSVPATCRIRDVNTRGRSAHQNITSNALVVIVLSASRQLALG